MTQEHRLVIGIDYGTTYTGVAYATPNSDKAKINEIDIVEDWGPHMGSHEKIPSVISYSTSSSADEQQWGASLSPDAITMINTKLELDPQDNKSDELDLILQALDGMNNLHFEHVKASKGYPEYTWKGPGDIVTDYLTKVFQYLLQAVANFSPQFRYRIPVDIVITVPVKWSYRAKNSTFIAVNRAGFNKATFPNLKDIIMVTEPEVAAIYTARYLKEDTGREFLKQGEYFVLCDAGGGTVDVVSYRVMQLEPSLELEPATLPTGAKCGSVCIDGAFKRWLKELLGDENYQELDPRNAGQKISSHATEGKQMRAIMKAFDVYKRKFCKDHRDMKMDLPEPLDGLSIENRVVGGDADMKSFFDPSIDEILELIQGQMAQIEDQFSYVKNIFLIGGFGESRYLQEELEFSLRLRKVQLRRPATSWTAVVRGAVIHGIEKLNIKNLITMIDCPRSYGINVDEVYSAARHDKKDCYTDSYTGKAMVNGRMMWLIRKGELLLSNERKKVEREFECKFWETHSRKFMLGVYECLDDELPSRFKISRGELKEVSVLNFDFAGISTDNFARVEAFGSKPHYYKTRCTCKMELAGGNLSVNIIWNEVKICSAEIKCE